MFPFTFKDKQIIQIYTVPIWTDRVGFAPVQKFIYNMLPWVLAYILKAAPLIHKFSSGFCIFVSQPRKACPIIEKS